VRASTFATLAPAATTNASVIGGFANSWSGPGVTTTSTMGAAWLQDDFTLWLGDSSTASNARLLTRYNRSTALPGSAWSVSPGYPIYNATVDVGGVPTLVSGARGLAGVVGAGGAVTLYVTSAAGLLRFEPGTGAWALVAAPCGGGPLVPRSGVPRRGRGWPLR
jgi:hypothetical protein